MKHELPQVATQYAKDHTRRRHWRQVVTCLAAIVVFCTTYALILPAITLEKTAQCGKSEHTHGASCYAASEAADAQALVCPLEEHAHTEACFQAQPAEPPAVNSVNAANPTPLAAEAPSGIALDTELNVEVPAGETVKIPFTPTATHEYIFSVRVPDGKRTYGYIYNGNGYVLQSANSTGDFSVTETLTAGQAYSLGVKYSSATDVGTVPVLLSYGKHIYQRTDDGQYACTCGLPADSTGACGSNAQWSFADGVLTISGTGTTPGFSDASATPWYHLRNVITKVVVDEGITGLGKKSFTGFTALTEVVFSEGLTRIGEQAFSECSGLTKVSFPDSLFEIEQLSFYNCTSLTSVVLPQNLRFLKMSAFCGCTSMAEITLNSSLASMGSYVFASCSGLETICWNTASNIWPTPGNWSHTKTTFQLALGPNSKLTQAQFQHLVKDGCAGIRLPKGHYLTLSALQADFLAIPITTLPESLYYADEQGVLYRVDETAGTAYLAYCPAELTSCTVPARLPEKEGHGPYDVVGVDTYAFYQASALTELTFEALQSITQLKDFAFYNAQKLASINEKTEETAVLAAFSAPEPGSHLFDNTLIAHAPPTVTSEQITLKENGLDVTITTTVGEKPSHDPYIKDNIFRLYTGEVAQTIISVSNPTDTPTPEGTVLRVYYRMEADGGRPYEPGTHTVKTHGKKTITLKVSETSVPYCYCLELTCPEQGDTISLNLDGKYLSAYSAGGTVTVWATILTKEEAEALGNKLPDITQSHVISWETKKDSFPVKKAIINSAAVKLAGNGEGGAYVTAHSYQIEMSRSDVTLENVGKDHMVSADFADVLTLPTGMRLSPAVMQAIRDGTCTIRREAVEDNSAPAGKTDWYIFRLPDGTQFMRLRESTGGFLKNLSLHTENGTKLELRWTYSNTAFSDKEMPSLKFTLDLENGILEVPSVAVGSSFTLQNDVTATQHFMHSGDTTQPGHCEITLTAGAGTLELVKSIADGYYCLGETMPMTITLKNPNVGLALGAHKLEDPLPQQMYMTAEQMAAALNADRQLTISISDAALCTPLSPQTVTGMDGVTTGAPAQQNTGANTQYNGRSDAHSPEKKGTITLKWGENDQLLITLSDPSDPAGTPQSISCDATGAAIQEVLEHWGYVIVYDTRYTLTWDLRTNGEPLVLAGGASVSKELTAAAKDSFMLAGLDGHGDKQNRWLDQWGYYQCVNTAYASYGADQQLTAEAMKYIRIDFRLNKNWTMHNGQAITPNTKLEQGMVLDYALTVEHLSTAHYDLLPLVDHMTGAQALIVPKELNQDAEWAAACETVILADGSEYYILKKPETYQRVWTGTDQMADTVVVKAIDSGLDTVIKWYFTDYSGMRTDKVQYHAMVCPQDVLSGGAKTFSVNNEAWLGDHEAHRLYDTISGRTASTLTIDKKIVSQVGSTEGGWSHSQIKQGSTVVYRLTIFGTPNEDETYPEVTINGSDLSDNLPETYTSKWNNSNVQIDYGDNVNVADADKEKWRINGNGHIVWDPGFQMTFTERADIYVTLQFPSDETEWNNYADRYASRTLTNTFYCLGEQASVTHDLSVQGKAWLQKGVRSSVGAHKDHLWYYSNSDKGSFVVQYYITIYNAGHTNLYLTELQDRLPRGFTFADEFGSKRSASFEPKASYTASERHPDFRSTYYTVTLQKQ